ncbi:hypothetical protein M413DRAFT_11833 [Hebeloma cylindrosporum]|uniref:Uncharacterized protein n=1 Tax=Hebeloma cylindrosporum TaxID=76867 RepID=A0A0C3BUQ9_HEBCY|nr:hypothetical protein M413DRAFT_11833 [Hebeloma cylindrosporum h7]
MWPLTQKARNISGLRNQQPKRPSLDLPLAGPSLAGVEIGGTTASLHSTESAGSPHRAPSSPLDDEGRPGDLPNEHDSAVGPEVDQDKNERDSQQEFCGVLDDEKFGTAVGDDPKDRDFLPKRRQREKIPGGRPKSYAKGPDVMSKSERTQRRYKPFFKDQTKLDKFFLSSRSDALSDMAHPTPELDTVDTVSAGVRETWNPKSLVYNLLRIQIFVFMVDFYLTLVPVFFRIE